MSGWLSDSNDGVVEVAVLLLDRRVNTDVRLPERNLCCSGECIPTREDDVDSAVDVVGLIAGESVGGCPDCGRESPLGKENIAWSQEESRKERRWCKQRVQGQCCNGVRRPP